MHALIGAYKPEGHEWVDELCEVLTENVNIAYDFFSNIDGIDTAKPEGTYMLFLDCKGWCTAHNQTLEDLYKKDSLSVSTGRMDDHSIMSMESV